MMEAMMEAMTEAMMEAIIPDSDHHASIKSIQLKCNLRSS